jgi:hypothetical protein
MIYVQNTPNNAGVYIYGDCKDFDAFYESLHTITDYMGTSILYMLYVAADNRVMAVCYDLRHALMGDREIEFVSNGFEDDETMDDETQSEMLHGTMNVFHIFQNKKINKNDDDGNSINNNNNTLPKIAGGKNVYLK